LYLSILFLITFYHLYNTSLCFFFVYPFTITFPIIFTVLLEFLYFAQTLSSFQFHCFKTVNLYHCYNFLADRTNGGAIGTVLRPSVVCCRRL